MNDKPLKQLLDKVGRPQLSAIIGVDISTIYLWGYREMDRSRGRRPNELHMSKLVECAKREGVKSLTIDYLAGL
jgi:hypothetical protein